MSQPSLEMFHRTCLFWRNFFLLENWLMVASVVLIWKTRSSYFCHCWHWQICAYNWWFLHLLLFNSKQKWSHFLSCKLSLHQRSYQRWLDKIIYKTEMKFGLFWAVGTAEKKTPNCHKYATFWGGFFNFLWAKKIKNIFRNILAYFSILWVIVIIPT